MAILRAESLTKVYGSGGDALQLPTPSGRVDLNVIGIVGGEDPQAFVPLDVAQDLFAQPGRVNTVEVALSAGASRGAARADPRPRRAR